MFLSLSNTLCHYQTVNKSLASPTSGLVQIYDKPETVQLKQNANNSEMK